MATIERNELFDLAYRFVTETGENIFLTGKAGTGKTTFLKYLKENCTKTIIVAAPTGVAAINAGGVTLHSLFQLPFHPFLPTTSAKQELLAKIRHNKQRQELLRRMELLVIDEISMVRCDVMDAIDTILKHVRRNHHLPFGGVQVLCIGDLHQLSPVAQNAEWKILSEYYESAFFFDSHAVKEQMPLLIELKKIYRQKEASFVELLNKVRNNNMSEQDFAALHDRFIPGFRPSGDEGYITLTSHNNQADLINQRELQRLNTQPFTYKAVIENEFAEHLYPAEVELVLKEGAQVMFLKNDPVQKRYFNGKIGKVVSLEKEKVTVDCDGVLIEVSKDTWENSRYTLNRADGKLEQETLGTFTQYPLRLAWAITIHKSQGLTFEKVMIDAGAAFSSGQVYVALSRCTSLEGIVLLSRIPSSAIYNNASVVKGQQLLAHKGVLEERFTVARQAFTHQLLEEIFSFNDPVAACDLLYFQINQQKDKLNNEAIAWVNEIKAGLDDDKNIGLRFISSIGALMREEAIIENNTALQKRISDAVNHYHPRFASRQESIRNHPLITEHKETANIINEHLQQLYLSVNATVYSLQYCKTAFSITQFLQHKLQYVLPRVNLTCYASGKKLVVADISNTELYDTLRRWRDTVCGESGLPIYMVANLASIKEICDCLPLTKKDLMLMSGFGKAKAEKYGDAILDMVQDYCERNNLETNMHVNVGLPKKERRQKIVEVKSEKPDTKLLSFNLYKEGKDITSIAQERNLATSTIESHLAHFVGKGEININEFVTAEKQKSIRAVAAEHGSLSHKAIFENLPEGYTYGEIRMVVALINAENVADAARAS